jgi:hypothetical protein
MDMLVVKFKHPLVFAMRILKMTIGVLQLAEPYARHFSFEYLSVYYTLHILTQGQKKLSKLYIQIFTWPGSLSNW